MYAKVLKTNPYHGKDGRFTSKEKATIGLQDVRSALGAVARASAHSKRMRAANPDHKLPYDGSRFAAYSLKSVLGLK